MSVEKRLLAVALAAAVVGSVVGAGAVALVPANGSDGPDARAGPGPGPTPEDPLSGPVENPELKQFDSEAAFQKYVRDARDGGGGYVRAGGQVREVQTDVAREARGGAGGDAGAPRGSVPTASGGGGQAPDRYSSTNVQEAGIREPDVLKTDGTHVFYSPRGPRYHHEDRIDRSTRVIDASSPADPTVVANVDVSGRMFLTGDRLVVLSGERVYGYDVSDPENPTRTWEYSLEGRVAAARMLDGTMYLVVQEGIDLDDPCPVQPLGPDGPEVGCTEVYHPVGETSAEVTYTTLQMNPGDGSVTDSVSVVGARDHAATYVSENAVYLTYTRQSSYVDLTVEFLLTNQSDLLDQQALSRLRQVREYNLSDRARRIEIQTILERWYSRLDESRRQAVRQKLRKRFQAYLSDHKRELTTTGIVKVGIGDGLSVAATGEVPGRPLDQFSMDERDGHLRIATTVGGFRAESANDLYVLDSNLDVTGSVKGMSEGQRIYSVRYVGDTAYVVTFRQVDPFHVVDLSDPSNPEQLGQVKLPGFSRYLHPLGEDRILGIGQEDGKVKATVFDVSDPANPKVLDSKVVDSSWSAIARSHHAFLQDRKHGVFFLPASNGGYVFSYGDGLELRKRVDTRGAARRAMYIDDYMYVFSQRELVVVDESDWSRETAVSFQEPDPEPPEEDGIPKVSLDWSYDGSDNGTLRAVHNGGDALSGENVRLVCGGQTLKIDDGTYQAGDSIVETTDCEAGQEAMLVWISLDGDRSAVLGQFEIPE